MQQIYVSLLAALLFVSHCHAADSTPAALANRLASLAGSNGRDCGSVQAGNERNAAIECARGATAAGKAYKVAVQLQGVDSLVWQGAARDEHGKLWVLFYDSDPSGGSGASPTLSALPCREIRFEVKGGDVIDCQPISGAPQAQ